MIGEDVQIIQVNAALLNKSMMVVPNTWWIQYDNRLDFFSHIPLRDHY
jgi:hypothetical protein